MTTSTTNSVDDAARQLAAIAVDHNEYAPPFYSSHLRAFVQAHRVLSMLPGSVDRYRLANVYDDEVERLLVEGNIVNR
jgi:hypothetical protein